MIKRAIRFCRGYRRIEVTSAYPERFLNMCLARDIELWDVERLEEGVVRCALSSFDCRVAMELEKKCMCSIEIIGKGGLVSALSPLAGRYFLFGAAALCAILCWVSSLYLWRVSIYGCRDISERELSSQLAALGLEPGARISAIDKEGIKLEIMSRRDDIAYITVNIRGSEARVDIKEREEDMAPDLPSGPCDIVCDKDGVIKSIQVLEGEKLASEGQPVIAGDRLVGGLMTSSQGEVRQVRSMANITLRTWRSAGAALSREVYALDPTGAVRRDYALEIGRRRIEGYVVEKSPYPWYYKTKEILPISIGGFTLPFARVVRETYYECFPRLLELSDEKCALLLEESCRSALEGMIGDGKIISSSITTNFDGGRLYLKMDAECEERAGRYAPINIGE